MSFSTLSWICVVPLVPLAFLVDEVDTASLVIGMLGGVLCLSTTLALQVERRRRERGET